MVQLTGTSPNERTSVDQQAALWLGKSGVLNIQKFAGGTPCHQTRVTSVNCDRKTLRSSEFETTLVSRRSAAPGLRCAGEPPRCAGEPSRLRVRPTSAGHDVNTVVERAVSGDRDWPSPRSSPIRKYVNSSPLPYNHCRHRYALRFR